MQNLLGLMFFVWVVGTWFTHLVVFLLMIDGDF